MRSVAADARDMEVKEWAGTSSSSGGIFAHTDVPNRFQLLPKNSSRRSKIFWRSKIWQINKFGHK